MVNSSVLSLAAVAAIASFAAADNCNTGLRYCGAGLLSKGNYLPQILDELSRVSSPIDKAHIYNTIFYCAGGSNGDIRYVTFCDRGCRDGGSGHDDFC
ncbi:hypothetical protein CCM_08711 [Cordyceps militaris CM01]|uniref:Uncharacterized protein n=1 Tax=Cordyceps militaris (strain CM01) TaxID=983644 RepID=G3JS20_CORMM|nr:uncharacterized protein CCM_08711 [Cordyceps militaris CM01]EGX88666.1 hypothetical protein CCM_08711 [Cordyceps militaris CM01]